MKLPWLLVCASLSLVPRIVDAQPDDIVGEWRGSSLCTNRQVAPACNDEQIHFVFTRRGTDPQAVHLDARKLVGANYETMGEMDLVYSGVNDEWSYVIDTPRVKARWSFRVVNGHLAGTLMDQPAAAQIRKLDASPWKP